MKIARLFEIVYILLDKKIVTAKELSEKFEVSTRTIYRDIDVLSSCGIPIYTNKGKGGGISLLDGFKIDKALLTKDEQTEIITALQGLKAADAASGTSALNKLSSFFNQNSTEWIDIDFSFWSNSHNFKDKFENIKYSIINHKAIDIDYSNVKGETTTRKIQPIKLLFKGLSWYLLAYCTVKNDYRVFKINRINNIKLLDEEFAPHTEIPQLYQNEYIQPDPSHNEQLELKIHKSMAFRVYDDFPKEDISTDKNGDFVVNTKQYDSSWIDQYILSYGDKIECIAPQAIQDKVRNILHKSINKYHNMTF